MKDKPINRCANCKFNDLLKDGRWCYKHDIFVEDDQVCKKIELAPVKKEMV